MEPPRSADELLASTLRTGDVVVFNRFCRSLAPHRAALCLASKYGLSGDGRGCWDHAALVVRDRRTDVAYLLEGGAGAVTMRTYEERMGEFADATEAVLLRAGAEASDAASAGLDRLLHDELRLRPSKDGFDAPGASRCDNLREVYRQLRAQKTPAVAMRTDGDGDGDAACDFGAPLVARGLQRLGLVEARVDAERVTPAQLLALRRTPRINLR